MRRAQDESSRSGSKTDIPDGTELVPREEAGHYLGISNLAGAGAGVVGAGIGGFMADFLDGYQPGLGYFAIFACYGVLFLLSTVSLLGVRLQRGD
jgi:MFS family permease